MRFLTKLTSCAVVAACAGGAGAQVLGPAVPTASGVAAGNTPGNGGQRLPVRQFGALLSENVKWHAFPAFPPEARLAVLVGDPATAGPYVVAVKLFLGALLLRPTHP